MINRYSSMRTKLNEAFLNEKLKNAISYDRIAGYFCSSILEVAGESIEKIQVKIEMPGNPFNGEIQDLDKYKDYYLTYIDKNRGGKDHRYIISEVDKGKILFKELGWAVFKNDEDAKKFL
jgi:hypothetical protein